MKGICLNCEQETEMDAVRTKEKMLRLAIEPDNLISLIEETPDALSEDKRERLLEELRMTKG